MADKIRICCDNKIYIGGIPFEKKEFSALCELEKRIPCDAYVHNLDETARLFAVKSQIGKEPHPLISMCEAARYIDNAWIVGIDEVQNRYFTPILTNHDENS